MKKKITEARLKRNLTPVGAAPKKFIKDQCNSANIFIWDGGEIHEPIDEIITILPLETVGIDNWVWEVLGGWQENHYEVTHIAPHSKNDDYEQYIDCRLTLYVNRYEIKAKLFIRYYGGDGWCEQRAMESDFNNQQVEKTFRFSNIDNFFNSLYQTYEWATDNLEQSKRFFGYDNSLNEARMRGETRQEKRARLEAELPKDVIVNPFNLKVAQLVYGAKYAEENADELKDTIERIKNLIPEEEYKKLKFNQSILKSMASQLNENADLIHAVFSYIEKKASEAYNLGHGKKLKLPINKKYTQDRYLKEARLKRMLKEPQPNSNEITYPIEGKLVLNIQEKVTLWADIRAIVNDPESIEDAVKQYQSGAIDIIHSEYFYDTENTVDPEDNDGDPTVIIKDENDNEIWNNVTEFNNEENIQEARLRGEPKPIPNTDDYSEIKLSVYRKKTLWEYASIYEPEAESLEHTINLLQDYVNFTDYEWETLYDTEEKILPEENDGQPTIEIEEDESRLVVLVI